MKCLVIAEAGINHNGDASVAVELVKAAADAGADIVKFQSFITSRSIARHAPKADYQIQNTGGSESQYEMVRQLELSANDHREIVEASRVAGIEFLSTAFDEESLAMLLELGIPLIKIPSGEITNVPFLRHIGSLGKSVILSTGMANLGEVECALEALESSGTTRKQVTILHCNSEYPSPMTDVNLRAMLSMREAFGVAIGYSDHTRGIEIPIAAVTLGAEVIEKHLTLDRSMPGPDHKASLEPSEFTAMVKAIRNIELALGDGIKRPSPSEIKNRAIARKSLVAAVPIRAGQKFTPKNVTAKRPGTGLSPARWDEVIGRSALRDFAQDELIEL